MGRFLDTQCPVRKPKMPNCMKWCSARANVKISKYSYNDRNRLCSTQESPSSSAGYPSGIRSSIRASPPTHACPNLVSGMRLACIPCTVLGLTKHVMHADNLYLDMNGIIHPCTHGDGGSVVRLTEDQMFLAVGNFVDNLMAIVKPQKLLFLAVDGTCLHTTSLSRESLRASPVFIEAFAWFFVDEEKRGRPKHWLRPSHAMAPP
jgi:hypothetical protein